MTKQASALTRVTSLLPRSFYWWACVAAITACTAFLTGLGGTFIFDDVPNIVKNPALALAGSGFDRILLAAYSFQPGNGTRFLPMLSFAFDYWRAGADPAAFKLTNICIQAVACVAVAAFLRKLLLVAKIGEKESAVFAILLSLIWAIHPLQVSTVLYIVQRMQTLCNLFVVVSIWCYFEMRTRQIADTRSRHWLLLCLLAGVMALTAKEDAILLPFYFLLVEMAFFRFQASNRRVHYALRGLFVALIVAATLFYVFYVIPKHWSWEVLAGRGFSTPQRLLTQSRILMQYLVQILVPLPSFMPFNYDEMVVSKSIVSPWTTLASIAALLGLLMITWKQRAKNPLFFFGVLFFFSGHALTSNIISLELAFEHRNHLPLLGIVIAVFALAYQHSQSTQTSGMQLVAGTIVLLITLTITTLYRSYIWGNPLRFATASIVYRPHSERAWLSYAAVFAQQSKMDISSPYFERAIKASERGAVLTRSPALQSNVVLMHSMQGKASSVDWQRLLDYLETAPMSPQTTNILWVMFDHVDQGDRIDGPSFVKVIEFFNQRTTFDTFSNLRIAAYLYNESDAPVKSKVFFEQAIATARKDDPDILRMIEELRQAGQLKWADQFKQLNDHRPN